MERDKTKDRIEVANKLRSSLNGLFSLFRTDNNLEALKTSIDMEKIIKINGFSIEYSTDKENKITRANKIVDGKIEREKERSIGKEYSHLLSKNRGNSEQIIVYNVDLEEIGISKRNTYLNNKGNTLRYTVTYIKKDNNVGKTAWYANCCKQFTTFDEFEDYIAESSLFGYDELDSFTKEKIENYKKKLNRLVNA
ncbi:hypothetical protein Bp8pS_141 [Bacillus phage vB_BpuM-BpSp]|nr:hypothetical protein Bp8pS_141 [Bacillus phage vB_BpuM-BpSp]